MDDPLLMRGFEGLRDLLRDQQRLVEWHRPSRDSLRQVLALDQLHHESGHASALFEPVDARDVGMIQRRERSCFALEAREPVGVMRERFGQDLDRDVAAQLGVASAKDLPHAPFADRSDDFVNAQTGAEGEGQRSELYGRRDSADGITPVTDGVLLAQAPRTWNPKVRAAAPRVASCVAISGKGPIRSRQISAVAKWIVSSVPSGTGIGSLARLNTGGRSSTRSIASSH